jgi:hypothetical protein
MKAPCHTLTPKCWRHDTRRKDIHLNGILLSWLNCDCQVNMKHYGDCHYGECHYGDCH